MTWAMDFANNSIGEDAFRQAKAAMWVGDKNLLLGCAARGRPRGGDTPGSSPRTRAMAQRGQPGQAKSLTGAVAAGTDWPGASRGATRGGPLRTPPVGWDQGVALGGNGLRGGYGLGPARARGG